MNLFLWKWYRYCAKLSNESTDGPFLVAVQLNWILEAYNYSTENNTWQVDMKVETFLAICKQNIRICQETNRWTGEAAVTSRLPCRAFVWLAPVWFRCTNIHTNLPSQNCDSICIYSIKYFRLETCLRSRWVISTEWGSETPSAPAETVSKLVSLLILQTN